MNGAPLCGRDRRCKRGLGGANRAAAAPDWPRAPPPLIQVIPVILIIHSHKALGSNHFS